MLVEAHLPLRRTVAEVVERQPDMTVVAEAETGLHGLRLAAEVEPDVVLADVNLPDIDGIAFTRQLVHALPAVRIIGLTLRDDPYTARSMREAGAEGLVSKTADVASILTAIRRT